jgi:3-methyladenine DNA glycosylase AlkD
MKTKPATLPAAAYFNLVRDTFRDNGNPDIALGQMAYMRHQFEFFGLKMPVWTSLAKQIHAEHGLPTGEDLKIMARLCFADEHRELHYFAIETVQKTLAAQPPEFIGFLEELVLEKSWWDSVDWLAKLVGLHFRKNPALIRPTTERWMASCELWLQRVCLIFQLTYRDRTDTALLFEYIRRVSQSKAFFLQKGAGWALRQHSKTDPEAVREFVENTPLAPLTRREATKYL